MRTMRYLIVLLLVLHIGKLNSEIITADSNYEITYKPNWTSLDARPLPDWYDKAKIGIFLHWGVYSVPGFGSEWFWMDWRGSNLSSYVEYMQKNYRPGFTYQDFAADFTAEFYDPSWWANLFKNSGAKYVVLTSKHHEGYTLWPSSYSYSWNSMDVGPHRNLLGELVKAVRNESLRMGFYYSLYEWFNPLYLSDKQSDFENNDYVRHKMLPELVELVETYEPDILWSDGDWEANDTYWKSTKFLAWLYNDSPVKDTIVVNDRWGKDIPCKHGGFFTCTDRYNPGVLQVHKWENAMTVDKVSWGHRKNIFYNDILTTFELIKTMVETVSCGGNILINVGPTKEGTIIPIFQERLLDLGNWLDINGEAIYETKPWTVQNDSISLTWYTSKPDIIYAITLEWPSNGYLSLGSVTDIFKNGNPMVELLGYNRQLRWEVSTNATIILLPKKSKVLTDWAWVLKIFNF